MKYIREYNGYGEYYQKIDGEKDLTKMVIFDEDQLGEIMRKLKDLYWGRDFIRMIILDYSGYPWHVNINYDYDCIFIRCLDFEIYIFAYPDEWFLVDIYGQVDGITKNGRGYYKCDQFDGLIKLLDRVLKGDKVMESNEYSEYYQKISIHEFKKNYVSGFLSRGDYDRMVKLRDRYEVEFIYGGVFITRGDIILTVYVGSDEWYYVHFDDDGRFSFYKCDQWEGLLKLIEDKL